MHRRPIRQKDLPSLFCLRWQSEEDSIPYLLYGPANYTEEEFRKLCDRLTQKAASTVLHRRARRRNDVVDWRDIVEETLYLLAEEGFSLVTPKVQSYVGSAPHGSGWQGIEGRREVLNPRTYKAIVRHNKAVYETL